MDRKKWEDARDALSAVMGLNIYDLYYDTQNPELSYAHYFCERKTKENIYTYLLAANATMHSAGLHPPIISRTAEQVRYASCQLDPEGRVMGMQVLFPVTVHPVILPGRVGKADN